MQSPHTVVQRVLDVRRPETDHQYVLKGLHFRPSASGFYNLKRLPARCQTMDSQMKNHAAPAGEPEDAEPSASASRFGFEEGTSLKILPQAHLSSTYKQCPLSNLTAGTACLFFLCVAVLYRSCLSSLIPCNTPSPFKSSVSCLSHHGSSYAGSDLDTAFQVGQAIGESDVERLVSGLFICQLADCHTLTRCTTTRRTTLASGLWSEKIRTFESRRIELLKWRDLPLMM